MAFTIDVPKKRKRNLEKIDWVSFFAFESYGVKVGIRSTDVEIIDQIVARLPLLLPTGFRIIQNSESVHVFSIISGKPRRENVCYKNDEEVLRLGKKDWKVDLIESQIRMTVAEHAENHVFLHAGAVGYKGKAIIIPARSFSGKTTLVAELAGRGCEYYSDEYAVVDSEGLVHPFPKQLSMRGIIDDHQQVDVDVEEYGGRKAEKPINVGLILVSKFQKRSKFAPKLLTSGEGIIECIANSVSIRRNPEFVLQVLGKVMLHAKVVRTNRGEAKQFADKFFPYLENLGI